MTPLGVHHVAINVNDVEAGIEFYTDVLGGTLRDERPDLGVGGAWITLGSSQVHLVESTVPPDVGQHFAVLVADLDEVVAELRGRGFQVGDPFVIGPDRQTFIDDPSGNTVELHQLGLAT